MKFDKFNDWEDAVENFENLYNILNKRKFYTLSFFFFTLSDSEIYNYSQLLQHSQWGISIDY